MNDDGLYERLHESEKRRKVAAILVDDFHEMVKSVSGEQGQEFVEVPATMVMLMCRASLAALAGDFDKLELFIPRWNDSPLRDRVQTVIDS